MSDPRLGSQPDYGDPEERREIAGLQRAAVATLAHVLAEVMPDVLDKKRREQWLDFAVNEASLVFGKDNIFYLHVSSVQTIRLLTWEGDVREVQALWFGINFYKPRLKEIISGRSIAITFSEYGVSVEYNDSQYFAIPYEDLPWLLIHTLQANSGVSPLNCSATSDT
jgi:hypothetical protein